MAVPLIYAANLRKGKCFGFSILVFTSILFVSICVTLCVWSILPQTTADDCGKNFFIKNTSDDELLNKVQILALCYTAPLLNFMFSSTTIYILPVHQRLNYPDPGGSYGRRALLIAISFTAVFYGVIYSLANLSCDDMDYLSEKGIPLLFNYLLNGTG